jgi:hypothetical protein
LSIRGSSPTRSTLLPRPTPPTVPHLTIASIEPTSSNFWRIEPEHLLSLKLLHLQVDSKLATLSLWHLLCEIVFNTMWSNKITNTRSVIFFRF